MDEMLNGSVHLLNPSSPAYGFAVLNFNLVARRSVVINITSTPEGFHSLTAWMKMETETKLQELLKQGDPQPTVEYALALVTVLNEVSSSHSLPTLWCLFLHLSGLCTGLSPPSAILQTHPLCL